ncbi:VOC family protein [Actinophytocola oryzae]|uniref:Putative enzyme related to lactoylglutathione lyase n=1 Tax=Actinophytocola oryzae TaxID=502181 RepID=A0A4R7W3S4_9PSEU|nr:VOC family protein [Actinophytocola oryzae]TDV56257.1 putative enzyme related to lactoylglutathione lyase [Actinophytocola oryzae]
MRIASLRVITDDVARLVGFYEHLTGLTATWATPDFAEITTPTFTLAVGSTRTVGVFGPGTAHAADNHSAIIEFLVDDVDAEYSRLRHRDGPPVEFVNEPADMPWGNRSLLVRDPDGTLVNIFTPVTDQAVAKWSCIVP